MLDRDGGGWGGGRHSEFEVVVAWGNKGPSTSGRQLICCVGVGVYHRDYDYVTCKNNIRMD